MVLVDVKPLGHKAEAKIQWTAAQLIGGLLVCIFSREESFWNQDLFRKSGIARKIPTAMVEGGILTKYCLLFFSFNFGVSRIV